MRNKTRNALIGVLFPALLFNYIAWMQVRAMTHFVVTPAQKPLIEALSFGEKLQLIFTGVAVPRPTNQTTPADHGLAYTAEMIALPNQEAIETWVVPAEPAQGVVLLFPGYANSKEHLLPIATAFHHRGYNVLLVDFRGAGGSTGNVTTLGVREAEDVTHAYAFARQRWPNQPIFLYGVSMGSAAILRAVRLYGIKPDAIVVESPFNRLLDTTRSRFRLMGLPAFPAAELMIFWGSVQLGFNGFRHNPVEDAAAVDCPTLVFGGGKDERATPDQVQAVFAALHGQKQLLIAPEVGHELLIRVAPEVWNQQIDWLLHSPTRSHSCDVR